MENKDAYNPKSMSYVPTYEEMKLPQDLIRRMETEFNDPVKNGRNEREYEAHLLRWQNRHREGLKVQAKYKKERKDQSYQTHWFVIKTDEERLRLIDESRSLAHEVMDEVVRSIRIPSLLMHAEGLRIAVTRMPISLFAASNDKLRRFPVYSLETDSLEGSPSSFYRLWSHVFKTTKSKRLNPRK